MNGDDVGCEPSKVATFFEGHPLMAFKDFHCECIKCGNGARHEIAYHGHYNLLKITCRNCGYYWWARCKDYVPEPPPPPPPPTPEQEAEREVEEILTDEPLWRRMGSHLGC